MAGLKYSRQREAVLAYLQSTKLHPTADTVYRNIRKQFPRISLGTVYRNLNLLADSGRILRLDCGDGAERFDATTEPHHHFVCRSCGRVLDMPMRGPDDLDSEAGRDFPGEIEGHRIYFYGICGECLG